MTAAVDYYAVLGVKPDASAAEIKTAYRAAAKKAHPDAGGSVTAMERLNEAYRVLSSPVARREYENRPAQRPTAPRPASTVHRRPVQYQPRAHHAAPDQQRVLNRWGRTKGLILFQKSLLVAIPVVFLSRFFIAHTPTLSARYIFALVGFAPVYGVILGLVFLIDPELRISLERIRLGRTYRHLSDFLVALGLTIAFVPLLALWLAANGV